MSEVRDATPPHKSGPPVNRAMWRAAAKQDAEMAVLYSERSRRYQGYALGRGEPSLFDRLWAQEFKNSAIYEYLKKAAR